MGHGEARNLSSSSEPDRPLNPALEPRLTAALDRLDSVDGEFKAGRDEARFGQQVKAWGRLSKEVDGHLRTIGNVLHLSHQLSLDIGSDGGGQSTRPWMEENSRKFDRLYFKLSGPNIIATCGTRTIGQTPLTNVNYEWLESMVVEWLVVMANAR